MAQTARTNSEAAATGGEQSVEPGAASADAPAIGEARIRALVDHAGRHVYV